MMKATDLLEADCQLSRNERIELAQAIWDSVSEEPPQISNELRAELEGPRPTTRTRPQS